MGRIIFIMCLIMTATCGQIAFAGGGATVVGSASVDTRVISGAVQANGLGRITLGNSDVSGVILGNLKIKQWVDVKSATSLGGASIRVSNVSVSGILPGSVDVATTSRIGRIYSVGLGSVSVANVSIRTPLGTGRTRTGCAIGNIGSTWFIPVKIGDVVR